MMSGSQLEQQIFAMCLAAAPSIYGDVLSADAAQMKNIKKLCTLISKAGPAIVMHIQLNALHPPMTGGPHI